MVNWRKVFWYAFFACLFSWPLAALFFFLGESGNMPLARMVAVVYMFGPALAALIMQKAIAREKMVGPLGIKPHLDTWKWYLLAWLSPAVLALGALAISLLFPGVGIYASIDAFVAQWGQGLDPAQTAEMKTQMELLPVNPMLYVLLTTILGGLIAGLTVNMIAAFGEELGWRGFLFKELQSLGFWKASLLTGFIWGAWHWPLIIQGHNYPQHPVAGIFLMIIWTMLLSPVMNLIRIKTGSVWSAAVFHGSLNGVAGLPLLLTTGGNDILTGITGLAGFLALAAANGLVALYLRRRPLHSEEDSSQNPAIQLDIPMTPSV